MHQVVFLRLGLEFFRFKEVLRALTRLEWIFIKVSEGTDISLSSRTSEFNIVSRVPLDPRYILNDAE